MGALTPVLEIVAGIGSALSAAVAALGARRASKRAGLDANDYLDIIRAALRLPRQEHHQNIAPSTLHGPNQDDEK